MSSTDKAFSEWLLLKLVLWQLQFFLISKLTYRGVDNLRAKTEMWNGFSSPDRLHFSSYTTVQSVQFVSVCQQFLLELKLGVWVSVVCVSYVSSVCYLCCLCVFMLSVCSCAILKEVCLCVNNSSAGSSRAQESGKPPAATDWNRLSSLSTKVYYISKKL